MLILSINKYFVSCTRLRPTITLNDSLRSITSYVSTSIKGYIASGTNNEIKIAEKDTVETELRFYCNDFDILINDLVQYENKTYEVNSEPKNTAHKNSHIKVFLRKVDEVKQH